MKNIRTIMKRREVLALGVVGLALASIVTTGWSPKPAPQSRSGATSNPLSAGAQQALEKQAKAAKVHMDRAHELLATGDPYTAELEANAALKLFPRFNKDGNPVVMQIVAEAKLDQGRTKEALSLYQKILSNGGGVSPLVRLETSLCYANLGDAAGWRGFLADNDTREFIGGDAVAQLPAETSIAAMQAHSLFSMGIYHLGQSNEEEAIRFLEHAMSLQPNNAEMAFWTAKASASLGRKAKALAYYRVAATSGAHAAEAKNRVTNLEQIKAKWPVEFDKIPPLPSQSKKSITP